ncbi:MAG: Uma2 family endonuclease [Pseudomonadota bacterium]
MSVKTKLHPISVEEYLEGEQRSDIRHEYISGHVYAMVGATARHNLIASHLHVALGSHLRNGPCRIFQSDMKVRIDDIFYYPDLMVTCGNFDLAALYLTNPVLIIEILSESTEHIDRREKRLAYQGIESLKEYVLAAQDKMEIEVYRRVPDGWEIERFGKGDELHLEAVDLKIPLAEVYAGVVGG